MNPVLLRKMSGFQLSISTGMAMETLFAPRREVYDPERTPPPRASLEEYDSVWINVHTLLRNIINATDYNDIRAIRPQMLAEALSEEIEQIQSLCVNEGQSKLVPVFYASSYSSFYRGKGPEYKLRIPTADKQVAFMQAISHAVFETQKLGLHIVTLSDAQFQPRFPNERCLLMSHVTPDLLGEGKFGKMELLESHTGKIKTRREWNTKYSQFGQHKWEEMPWCKQLLCFLGDKYILQPLSIGIRKQIQELAKDRHWTPMTHPSAINSDLMLKIKQPEVVKVLRQIGVYH